MVQERIETQRRDEELVHLEDPDDCVLNLAQLRSSSVLLMFRNHSLRYPGTHWTRNQLVDQAIKNRAELDLEAARKKLAAQQKEVSKQTRKASKRKTSKTTSTTTPELVSHSRIPPPLYPTHPEMRGGADINSSAVLARVPIPDFQSPYLPNMNTYVPAQSHSYATAAGPSIMYPSWPESVLATHQGQPSFTRILPQSLIPERRNTPRQTGEDLPQITNPAVHLPGPIPPNDSLPQFHLYQYRMSRPDAS